MNNDDISKKALLEWLDVEIDLSSGNSETEKADRWAFGLVRRAIKSGRFDIPSPSEGEAEGRYKDVVEHYKKHAEAYGQLVHLINLEVRHEKDPAAVIENIKLLINKHVGLSPSGEQKEDAEQ